MATQAEDAPKTAAPARKPRASTKSAAAAKSATGTPGTRASKRRPRTAASAGNKAGVGTMIGAAAAGLAAGLVANLGRKAAMQAPSVMAGDWLQALKAEHKAALALFDAIEATSEDQPAKRTHLLIQLKHALGKHAFTEENVVYPALREWGDKADADKLNHDHGYVKQHLYVLDNMGKDDPRFMAEVAEFRTLLEAHVREEEDKIFPPLHAALSPEKNKAVTSAANKEAFKLA